LSECMSLGTCSFNTPQITATMIRSYRYTHPDWTPTDVLVEDHSTNNDTNEELRRMNIHVSRYWGRSHEKGVDPLITRCRTRYLLLVDTDVIFLKNCDDLVKMMGDNVILGNVSGDRGGKRVKDRVDPWFCLIDIGWMREESIKFYDPYRFWTSTDDPDIERYDVGSSFLEDIRAKGLGVKDVNLEGEYFRHYEGLSWHGNSTDSELLRQYNRKMSLYEIDKRKYMKKMNKYAPLFNLVS